MEAKKTEIERLRRSVDFLFEVIDNKDRKISELEKKLKQANETILKARQCTLDVVSNCYLNDN